jgi:hypothetical protein
MYTKNTVRLHQYTIIQIIQQNQTKTATNLTNHHSNSSPITPNPTNYLNKKLTKIQYKIDNILNPPQNNFKRRFPNIQKTAQYLS